MRSASAAAVEEARQVLRVVREIRVHLEHEAVVVFQRPGEAGEVGASQAVLRLPMQDVHARIAGGEFVGHRTGAVRRSVVDDEDVERRVLRQDRRNDLRQVLALVVRRYNDQRPFRH